MLKVSVKSDVVTTRDGVSKKGTPYQIRSQNDSYVQIGMEIRKFEISLDQGQSPYPVGDYLLDVDSMVTVGRFGSIEMRPFINPVLRPVNAAVKAS
jgi:hypothetical protein